MENLTLFGFGHCIVTSSDDGNGNLSSNEISTAENTSKTKSSHIKLSDSDNKNVDPTLLLPLYSIQIYVELNVNIANVYIKSSFFNTKKSTIDGVFTFPSSYSKAVLSSCDISYGDKSFSTILLDSDETKFAFDYVLQDSLDSAHDLKVKQTMSSKSFVVPFSACPANSEIVVELKYSQELIFDDLIGDYSLIVPLFIPSYQPIINDYSAHEITSIICKIYPGNTQRTKYPYASSTHSLKLLEADELDASVTLSASALVNSDFHIRYHAWMDRISPSCVILPSNKEEESGSFLLYLNATTPSKLRSIPRNVVG
jgi:hypothetical protein